MASEFMQKAPKEGLEVPAYLLLTGEIVDRPPRGVGVTVEDAVWGGIEQSVLDRIRVRLDLSLESGVNLLSIAVDREF